MVLHERVTAQSIIMITLDLSHYIFRVSMMRINITHIYVHDTWHEYVVYTYLNRRSLHFGGRP